jgi:hypothetical protein
MCYFGVSEASPTKRERIVEMLRRWMRTDAAGAFVGVRMRGLDVGGLLAELQRDFGRAPGLRDIARLRGMADLVDFLVRDCPE